MKSHNLVSILLSFFSGESMKKIHCLLVLANLSFLLGVCGCGESKEEKAARELKEAASKIEKLFKK